MKESVVHFRHKSQGRVLWQPARFAQRLFCPLGHAQQARCDVLQKPYITTLTIHNLPFSCRLLFYFGSCCKCTNTGFFVVLKPVTRRITRTHEKDFSQSRISCVRFDIHMVFSNIQFSWCRNKFKNKRRFEGKYDIICHRF